MNRRMSFLAAIYALLIAHCFVTQSAMAQSADLSDLDPKPITEAVKAYETAFNAGNAKAISEMWTEQAVYTNRMTNEGAQGRKAILEQFQAILGANPRPKMELTSDSIRFLSPSIAIEHGTAKLSTVPEVIEVYHYTAIYLKQGDKWLLDRVTDEEAESLSYHAKLKELEWMVGTWEAKSEDASVALTCQWATNKSYLTRSFSIVANGESMVGTQIIGWDPVAKSIRSWTFDQQGAFAEGTWTKVKDHWVIANKGYQSDGAKVGMVNVLKPIDDNTFTWKTLDRMAGGELLPALPEISLSRVDE
jgi:uncharacterized protein (TIGR02246 family)